MDINTLDNVIEAILFLSGNGIKISDLTAQLEIQKSELERSLNRLKEKYNDNSGIQLIRYNGAIQLCTNPKYAGEIETVLNPIKEKALSSAVLETVAIIAYRQPITKLEIEQIRGVSSEYAVGILLKNNFIEVVGRKDVIGKPLLFGTTDEFLKRFRIESLDDLPDYDKLLESIKVLNETSSRSLYNEFELPESEQLPDHLKDEA